MITKLKTKIEELFKNNKRLFFAVTAGILLLLAGIIVLIVVLFGTPASSGKASPSNDGLDLNASNSEDDSNSHLSENSIPCDSHIESELPSISEEQSAESSAEEQNSSVHDSDYTYDESETDDSTNASADNTGTSDSSAPEVDDSSVSDSSAPEVDDSSVSDSSAPEVDDSSASDSSAPEVDDSSASDFSAPEVDDSSVSDSSAPEVDDSSASDSSAPEVDDSSASDSSAPEVDDSSVSDSSAPEVDDSSASDSSAPEVDDSSVSDSSAPEVDDSSVSSSSAPESDDTSTGDTNEDPVSSDAMFTNKDLKKNYDASGAITITLEGNAIYCNFPQYVTINGTTATIKDEGVYILRGTLNNGMIKVEAELTDKIQLVLYNATISSNSSAPVYVKQADKVFVTAYEGTSNTLIAGSQFVAIDENNIDAAIFSKEDLTLNGAGNLTIQSPAGHGVVSKDDLVITGGTYTVISSGHAFAGKNSLRIGGGTFIIRANKDGFHAEDLDNSASGFLYTANVNGNITANITAGGDAISGQYYLTMNGGTFEGTSGGGSNVVLDSTLSAKGIKCDGTITINSGTEINLNTADDGIHTSGNIIVNGGDITLTSGYDCFQADTTLTVNGGTFNLTAGGGASAYNNSTASAKGLKSTGVLTISNGNISINSADDGIHSNSDINISGGVFNISSGDDAMHSDTNLNVTGGTVNVAKSYEGLEATHIVLNGGDISLTSADDGLNAAGGVDSSGSTTGAVSGRPGRPGRPGDNFSSSNGTIKIYSGTLFINANGDGIDANGSIEMTGGDVIVSGPTSGGNGSLDYDGTATISGGTFIAIGSKQMAMNFSSASNQGCALFTFPSTQTSNTAITLKDSNGYPLYTWTSDKTYSSVVISCPDFIVGGSYALSAGSYSSGTFSLSGNGIYKKNG